MSTLSAAESLSLPTQELHNLYHAQRAFFDSGATRSYEFRRGQLGALRAAIQRREKQFFEALAADLRKDDFEAYGTELGLIYAEITHTLKHLRSWMQPRRASTPLMFFPGKSWVVQEPLGITLHISPWNYPLQLALVSLIPAIAGGNTAILKPSELAPATEAVLRELIEDTFEPEYIALITGPGHLVTEQLIEQYHFDHIFYTGSTAVGRIIMQAAARQLSPVTLELGGKSPCIVTADANLSYTVRKIAFGKTLNAGQTCIAPDYVLVHRSLYDSFVKALANEFERQYGKDASGSPHYGRIINQRQFDRLCGYLQEGHISYGGQVNAAERFIAPTILTGVSLNDKVMQEEIFGPILPVIPYEKEEEALQIIDVNPYPLSLYVFTGSRSQEEFFTRRVRFGNGCINNTMVHFGIPDIPFGGVGYSGIGKYHGLDGFQTFTHAKSLHRSLVWADAPLWYPPRKAWYMQVLRRLLS